MLLLKCTREAEWTPFQTHHFKQIWSLRESNPDLLICIQELWALDHRRGHSFVTIVHEYNLEQNYKFVVLIWL
jgi:hypothetical protein